MSLLEALEAPQQFDPIKDILIDKSLTKKQIERLNSLHMKFKDVFNGDLREGYNEDLAIMRSTSTGYRTLDPPLTIQSFHPFATRRKIRIYCRL